MAFIHTSLTVNDIAALKALTSSTTPKRADKVFLAVEDNGTGDRAWYQYKASASDAENLPKIVAPTDNNGRWFQFAGGGETLTSFGGVITCASGSTVDGTGKAFAFYSTYANLELQLVPSFDISITNGTTSIQVHRWSQEPNTGLLGREFLAELPHTGGSFTIDIDSTYRWFSVFARNPSNSTPDAFDGVYLLPPTNGNIFTLVNF